MTADYVTLRRLVRRAQPTHPPGRVTHPRLTPIIDTMLIATRHPHLTWR